MQKYIPLRASRSLNVTVYVQYNVWPYRQPSCRIYYHLPICIRTAKPRSMTTTYEFVGMATSAFCEMASSVLHSDVTVLSCV